MWCPMPLLYWNFTISGDGGGVVVGDVLLLLSSVTSAGRRSVRLLDASDGTCSSPRFAAWQLGGPLRLPCRSAGWLLAWLSATRVRLVSLGTTVLVRCAGRPESPLITVCHLRGRLSECMVCLYLYATI